MTGTKGDEVEELQPSKSTLCTAWGAAPHSSWSPMAWLETPSVIFSPVSVFR
ncbi:hypothetical protein [Brevibacterium linens]|uniref:hypothetical protein n=1 Tax=Brevibacterium linens TaxID=1703 RepID=UPI0012E9164A|nr:hypothetical protein [Brevibacterium linens]